MPVPCYDENVWREFMRDKGNILLAQDTIGEFHVVTVFLGFNHGTLAKPKFFQTTCFGTDGENHPRYSETWQRACLEHRGKIACAQALTKFAAEKAAGIERSFKFIDCKFAPGEIQFLLESEADAVQMMPTSQKHWERRGQMVVFLIHPKTQNMRFK
ncbi:hypothetical protein IQ260_23115 [Leptolyngbya cf. ectocarpi LEGE 11479]|uniref:Uncharacterized protein n=1 Tax=Leptolyngbya cf. ectocarpi LEGE 11479 TaxID=1828722 RepID=A0A928ZY31_LEPEC|nr:hypothetical protein [Leptolyngbya ectocarpi]MBE9069540.1 hypothetical protein [Leptolyngbya cf. ectocarpi LEGE 11479]